MKINESRLGANDYNYITQYNYPYYEEIVFLGWWTGAVYVHGLGDYTVAIWKIKYKQP